MNLNQMFNGGGMPQGMPGGMPGMPGMGNPQQMAQQMMKMMGGNKGGNPQQMAQDALNQQSAMLKNLSVDDYNKYLLQALTKFDDIYGRREGTLTAILFNSGLSIDQLKDAITQYKGK